MHVAFSLLTLDPGRVGGSETFARGLLGAYAQGAGPERVTVLARPGVAAGLPSEVEVTTAELPLGRSRPGRLAGLLGGLARAPAPARAVAAEADVVHYPLTVPIPRAPGPSVVSLHDVLHHDLPQHFSRAERTFRRFAYDAAARRATRVVTLTEYARGRIVGALGIAPERVVAIHPGVDHARFAPEGDGVELALPPEPWLLYPAALWPHKNHARLLAALPADVSLVLTGETFGRTLRHDRVHHLGHVPAETLPALYRAATALVFPSLAEGFGLPPLEAMACGCPVAASDAGAIAEACGDAALLFDARDEAAMAAAMTRIVSDDALRAELREAGLERAHGFTWERAAARYTEVYVSSAR